MKGAVSAAQILRRCQLAVPYSRETRIQSLLLNDQLLGAKCRNQRILLSRGRSSYCALRLQINDMLDDFKE